MDIAVVRLICLWTLCGVVLSFFLFCLASGLLFMKMSEQLVRGGAGIAQWLERRTRD